MRARDPNDPVLFGLANDDCAAAEAAYVRHLHNGMLIGQYTPYAWASRSGAAGVALCAA